MIQHAIFQVFHYAFVSIIAYFCKIVAKPRDHKAGGRTRVIVIKMDAIGDYVLFRNYLSEIVVAHGRDHVQLTLIGNLAWRPLFEAFDKTLVDDVFWIDRGQFYRSFRYVFSVYREISKLSGHVAIYPSMSREFLLGDLLIFLTTAREKIGCVTDLSNQKRFFAAIGNNYFSALYEPEPGVKYEFERNRDFFQWHLKSKIALLGPSLPSQEPSPLVEFQGQAYAVLFVGASAPSRVWPMERFADVARFLSQRCGWKVAVAGGPQDVEAAKRLCLPFASDEVLNLAGRTSLVELAKVLGHARLVVANDTGAAHLAVASGVKTVVVSNGNHIGRFVPVGSAAPTNLRAVFPRQVAEHPQKYIDDYGVGGFRSEFSINQIPSQLVIEAVLALQQRG